MLGLDKGASRQKECELVAYVTGLDLPLYGEPLQTGEVWHYSPEHGKKFQRVTLSLHSNGFSVNPHGKGACVTIAWSPFALAHSVKLHTSAADASWPTMRFFKVLVFHHGSLHFFGTDGESAEKDRAQWVATIARSHRDFTKSLFPCFALRTGPLPGADLSSTRLLAGYLLQCEGPQVSLMWCELHLNFDGSCYFDGYAGKTSDAVTVLGLPVESGTQISKAQGCDNGCFTLAGCNFAARTCAEKELWLRVIQNVKVKLLHRTLNPTPEDNMAYRAAILERVQRLGQADELDFTKTSLLPRAPVSNMQKAPGMFSRSTTFTRPGGMSRESTAPIAAPELTPRGLPVFQARPFTPSRSLEHMRPPSQPLHLSEAAEEPPVLCRDCEEVDVDQAVNSMGYSGSVAAAMGDMDLASGDV